MVKLASQLVTFHGIRDDHTLFTMLLGTGIDLVEIRRIENSIGRYGNRFLHRVFTPGEIAYCLRKKQSAESFAARFAAKEAAAKALGTGIQYGVAWKEFEVVRAPGQRPGLLLHGRAAELALGMGVEQCWLAITHGRDVAAATVHMEGPGAPEGGAATHVAGNR